MSICTPPPGLHLHIGDSKAHPVLAIDDTDDVLNLLYIKTDTGTIKWACPSDITATITPAPVIIPATTGHTVTMQTDGKVEEHRVVAWRIDPSGTGTALIATPDGRVRRIDEAGT